jgi:hypothetical protein
MNEEDSIVEPVMHQESDEGDSMPPDKWSEFREDDGEPIGVEELKGLALCDMPDDIRIRVMDNYFPDTTVWHEGDLVVCEIEEHLYTKFWEHKFSAYAFAEAMERAARRLAHEGHPIANPSRDDDDVHIFVRWQLQLPRGTTAEVIVDSVKACFELVWQRADTILEDSDSVLILGKDTGPALDLLRRIALRLQELGYFTYIIKDQPDRPGEGVVQKVLRYALSSKFVLIENSEASGHLYEIPHVAKAGECVTIVLQESGKGATWMFEDAYAKHNHWHKVEYDGGNVENAVDVAAEWAEKFVRSYAEHQRKVLPWLRSK